MSHDPEPVFHSVEECHQWTIDEARARLGELYALRAHCAYLEERIAELEDMIFPGGDDERVQDDDGH